MGRVVDPADACELLARLYRLACRAIDTEAMRSLLRGGGGERPGEGVPQPGTVLEPGSAQSRVDLLAEPDPSFLEDKPTGHFKQLSLYIRYRMHV